MWKIKHKFWAQIFIIYTRYLLGSAFVFASIVKIGGGRFTTESGELEPINSSWHLFETLYASGLYWKFLGIGQLLAGFLLMTQRFAKLGAVIFFPIILNIFIITLSYYFAYTPVITGLMLCANLLLFAWDWNEYKIFFNLRYELDMSPRLEKDTMWQIVGLLLFSLVLLFRTTEGYNFFILPMIYIGIVVTTFLIAWKRQKKISI